jgi:small neutral amino acid transporter SnatA (MarC family)
MTNPNVKEIEEARCWGRSLILNGLLLIMFVFFLNFDWTEGLIIISIGTVMIAGGFYLCRFSDDALSQISHTQNANEL